MPESFADLLDTRKRTAVAVFHRFWMEVGQGLQRALFVEGYEDKVFYSTFLPVGELSSEMIRLSYGKKNLDKIVEQFYAQGLDERCDVYFIRDADFDEFLGNLPSGDRVRILDRYSVENFVFTADNFRRLLMERFGVEPDEYNVACTVARYERCVQEIFLHIAPLIGAALLAVQEGFSINFDALDVRKLASSYFRDGNLEKIEDATYERCKIPAQFRTDVAVELGSEFVRRDALLWLRGHYLADIGSVFAQFVHDELKALKAEKEIRGLNPRLSVDFSPQALFERMCSFCERPGFVAALE